MARLPTRRAHDLDHVAERLTYLSHEIVALELAGRRIPPDLSGDRQDPAARGDAVGVAARTRPAFRFDDL